MSKFLPCKSVCPVVAELRHDVANRDTEINRLYGVIDHRDGIIDDLLVQVRSLTGDLVIKDNLAAQLASDYKTNLDLEKKRSERLRDSNRENEKRLAKVRQAAFGIVDWGIED